MNEQKPTTATTTIELLLASPEERSVRKDGRPPERQERWLAWRFAGPDGRSAFQKTAQEVGVTYALPFAPSGTYAEGGVLRELAHHFVPVLQPLIRPGFYGFHASLGPVHALIRGSGLFVERVALTGEVVINSSECAASERTTLWRANALLVLLRFSLECSTRALDAVKARGLAPDARSYAILGSVRELIERSEVPIHKDTPGEKKEKGGGGDWYEQYVAYTENLRAARTAADECDQRPAGMTASETPDYLNALAPARAAEAAWQTGAAAYRAVSAGPFGVDAQLVNGPITYGACLCCQTDDALAGKLTRTLYPGQFTGLWQQKRLHTMLLGLAPAGYKEPFNG